MQKKSSSKEKGLFVLFGVSIGWGALFWFAVAVVSIICIIGQQITINKFTADKAALEKEHLAKKERYADIENEDPSLSDEEAERKAREDLGMVKPGEQILVAE